MKNIGITGQDGFVGSHLYNFISLLGEEFTLIPFQKAFFKNNDLLVEWAEKCDVIVHLAAMNRHLVPETIHDNNIDLVQRLITALNQTTHNIHVIFSSSTQEERDNLYGKSKKEGRALFLEWAEKCGGTFTGLVIPNVYGPFGKPFYNSVVATFCYQLCHGQIPQVEIDSNLKLIYVNELVSEIIACIRKELHEPKLILQHTSDFNVSQLLSKLNYYMEKYLEKGIIPELPDKFSLNLFNTFRSHIELKNFYPKYYLQQKDDRGKFVELIRLEQGGQVSFSTTKPGITRGNHFHTRKIERFSVIKGKALIQLRKYNTNDVLNFELDGENSSYVDMPVWYTHNIKNIGDDELLTVFWINEMYDEKDPDTYFETV